MIECVGKNKHGWCLMRCRCDCGKETVVNIHSLKNNHTKSCGCNVESKGFKNNKLRKSYLDMLNRCYNPKCSNYSHYGYRGVAVCDEWRCNWDSFKEWSINNGYAENLTIDRIDVNGNYEPNNCRWVNMHFQVANRRVYHSNKSNYCGIDKRKDNGRWRARIIVNRKLIALGHYTTKKEALEARNRYIIENGLLEYPIQEWRG